VANRQQICSSQFAAAMRGYQSHSAYVKLARLLRNLLLRTLLLQQKLPEH
jgi:hypothetical protein